MQKEKEHVYINVMPHMLVQEVALIRNMVWFLNLVCALYARPSKDSILYVKTTSSLRQKFLTQNTYPYLAANKIPLKLLPTPVT